MLGPAPSLTRRAHAWLATVLAPGDIAVDATVGNGHDTLFLARCVGAQGRVVGFDLQRRAIEQTRQRLAAAGLLPRVDLHLAGHEHLLDHLPDGALGTVAAVCFNLGYLPGGDKSIITRPGTTRAALDAAWLALRPDGLMTVLAYVGHRGGAEELAEVQAWHSSAHGPPPEVEIERGPAPNSPVLLVYRKGAALANARQTP